MTPDIAILVLKHWKENDFLGRVKTNQVLEAERVMSRVEKYPVVKLPEVAIKPIEKRKPKEERDWEGITYQNLYLKMMRSYYNEVGTTEVMKDEFLEFCKDKAFRELWAPKLNLDLFYNEHGKRRS